MSKLTREEVLKLAALSKLRLNDKEVESLRAELSEILDYVEVLNKSDTKGLEPTYQVTGLHNVTRKDEIKKYQATPAELIAQAPQTSANHFKVKRVL